MAPRHESPMTAPASAAPTHQRRVQPSPEVVSVVSRLWDAGDGAVLVGGGVRDQLLGRPGHDVDIATDALPERILELFPGGRRRGAFGTIDIARAQAHACP